LNPRHPVLEQDNRFAENPTKPTSSTPADVPLGDVLATNRFDKMPDNPPTKCREKANYSC